MFTKVLAQGYHPQLYTAENQLALFRIVRRSMMINLPKSRFIGIQYNEPIVKSGFPFFRVKLDVD
jgi:hypothetical protein